MQVGVNYPWLDYGWDFGLGPPPWRGSRTTPRWYGTIDRHLQHFHDLGVAVVRWFVLADGLTYGTGGAAPTPDFNVAGGWRFTPPPLGADIRQHFDELLQRFAAFNAGVQQPILLLPVLIDFHFCYPGTMPLQTTDPLAPFSGVHAFDWVKQGRADAIADADKRERFLDEVLDPLLRVSQYNPDTIYAWELINEPDWITNGWHPDGRDVHPIDEPSMRAFLEAGKDRIRRAGFKPTIGFALRDTLRRSGITTEINQFHHYPAGSGTLAPHRFADPGFPAIIGEFATATNDIWPELADSGQRVLHRLRLAAELGYSMAIPWSFLSRDRHTSWAAVEADMKVFVEEQAAASDRA